MDQPRAAEAASATGALVGLAGAATAAAVSACCAGPLALGPLVVAVLGAGGAVAFEGLRPYAPELLVLAGIAIAVAFWMNARAARRCTTGRGIRLLRITSRTLVWLSAAVWVGAVVAFAWTRADSAAMPFTPLTTTDEPLRAAFNRDKHDVRVVELVSPTCPFCLEGVSKLQHTLFANEPSSKLSGFIVWVPMLDGKAENVPEAAALAPDPRVRHYWDGSNDLGTAFERLLPVATGPAWDVYLLYAPGIVWSGATPPRPTFWMHQLAISNAPHLDAQVFADRARAMLAAR